MHSAKYTGHILLVGILDATTVPPLIIPITSSLSLISSLDFRGFQLFTAFNNVPHRKNQ